jgi:hypothetical protein
LKAGSFPFGEKQPLLESGLLRSNPYGAREAALPPAFKKGEGRGESARPVVSFFLPGAFSPKGPLQEEADHPPQKGRELLKL